MTNLGCSLLSAVTVVGLAGLAPQNATLRGTVGFLPLTEQMYSNIKNEGCGSIHAPLLEKYQEAAMRQKQAELNAAWKNLGERVPAASAGVDDEWIRLEVQYKYSLSISRYRDRAGD